MDDNKKFIGRLSPVEREHIIETISRILARDTAGLDVKKLRGYADIFRVRVGRIRIIYTQNVDDVRIVQISFRKEDTYK